MECFVHTKNTLFVRKQLNSFAAEKAFSLIINKIILITWSIQQCSYQIPAVYKISILTSGMFDNKNGLQNRTVDFKYFKFNSPQKGSIGKQWNDYKTLKEMSREKKEKTESQPRVTENINTLYSLNS